MSFTSLGCVSSEEVKVVEPYSMEKENYDWYEKNNNAEQLYQTVKKLTR